MIWNPFKRKPKGVVYPFRPLIEALKAKDGDLYSKIGHLSPPAFRDEWRKVYPEDFPPGDEWRIVPKL